MADRRRGRGRTSRRMVNPGQDAIAQEDPFLYDDAESMDEAAVNFGQYVRILREWAEAARGEEDGYE